MRLGVAFLPAGDAEAGGWCDRGLLRLNGFDRCDGGRLDGLDDDGGGRLRLNGFGGLGRLRGVGRGATPDCPRAHALYQAVCGRSTTSRVWQGRSRPSLAQMTSAVISAIARSVVALPPALVTKPSAGGGAGAVGEGAVPGGEPPTGGGRGRGQGGGGGGGGGSGRCQATPRSHP